MHLGDTEVFEVIDIVIVVCLMGILHRGEFATQSCHLSPSRQLAINHANPDSARFFRRERLP